MSRTDHGKFWSPDPLLKYVGGRANTGGGAACGGNVSIWFPKAMLSRKVPPSTVIWLPSVR
jgi:hypothetical protein